MLSLCSISYTLSVQSWLAFSRHPRILHIFERACNLINEQGEVLSIVTPQVGRGPFNLVVDIEVCFPEYLSLESPVYHTPNHLQLGDLAINVGDVDPWSPHPEWEKLRARKEKINKSLAQYSIPNHIPLLPGPEISKLSHAFAEADIPASLTIASQLAGLGQGLTPSGDDFLMGAMYAVWIIHPPEVASILAGKVSTTAAPLTTSLSAAWLRSAGRGEAGLLWHLFFEALVSADDKQIEITIGKILDVGETSGADALAGFVGTFWHWAAIGNPNNS